MKIQNIAPTGNQVGCTCRVVSSTWGLLAHLRSLCSHKGGGAGATEGANLWVGGIGFRV